MVNNNYNFIPAYSSGVLTSSNNEKPTVTFEDVTDKSEEEITSNAAPSVEPAPKKQFISKDVLQYQVLSFLSPRERVGCQRVSKGFMKAVLKSLKSEKLTKEDLPIILASKHIEKIIPCVYDMLKRCDLFTVKRRSEWRLTAGEITLNLQGQLVKHRVLQSVSYCPRPAIGEGVYNLRIRNLQKYLDQNNLPSTFFRLCKEDQNLENENCNTTILDETAACIEEILNKEIYAEIKELVKTTKIDTSNLGKNLSEKWKSKPQSKE